MKALVRNSTTPEDHSLQELAVPKPSGPYLLAKVAYAGICASDLDILYDRNEIYKPPVVQGHEYSAVVVEVGEEVTHFMPGDLVTSETTLDVKGTPNAYELPDYQLMAGKRILGWTENGGFAEYVLLNSHFCHKFASATSPKIAALCEPLAIAAESIFVKGNLAASDVIAVVGPGPIGILCALMAKYHLGAENTYLIGLPEDAPVRLAKTKQLGVKCLTVEDSVLEIIQKENGGRSPDAVIDASGSIKGFELALDMVKRNGKIVETGSITSKTLFSWERAAYQALNLYFVFSSSRRAWEIAANFIDRTNVDLESLVTGVFSLQEYEQAYAAAKDVKKNIKVMFRP